MTATESSPEPPHHPQALDPGSSSTHAHRQLEIIAKNLPIPEIELPNTGPRTLISSRRATGRTPRVVAQMSKSIETWMPGCTIQGLTAAPIPRDRAPGSRAGIALVKEFLHHMSWKRKSASLARTVSGSRT